MSGKKKLLVITCIIFSLVIGLIINSCTPEETSRLKVVTSTSHLEQLVKQIGGDFVDVINIVPAASHPGDFDASPNDIRKLADADLFLWHNWPGETYVEALIESVDNPALTVIAIEIKGSWMTPPVQLQAIDKVSAELEQMDSNNSDTYRKASEDYKEQIKATETEVRSRLAEINPTELNVLCAGWQAGLISWAGFNIIDTYGLPVPPTIGDIEKLIEIGKENGVVLVVDNLHDNPDAGKPIAKELDCERVILYNFPGVDSNTKNWEETFEYNIELILGALSQ